MFADVLAIDRAWQRFVNTGEIESNVVREEVARSWRRCREAGIDPWVTISPVSLSSNEIQELLRSSAAYVEAAMPFLKFLESIVRGTGFLLVLTNEEGFVLELLGSDDVVLLARQNHYVPGCCRSEMAVGTNAIAMALRERQPIQLFGAEHYNVHLREWTCATAPILSPEGRLLGSVTLSGRLEAVQIHTLGMVISTAEAIQNRIREQRVEMARLRDEQLMLGLLKATNEALITLNADGEVVKANHLAEVLLGQDEKNICGQNAAKLFGAPELTRILAGRSEAAPFEMSYERGEQRNYLIARPYIVTESPDCTGSGSISVLGAILAVSRRRDFLKHVQDLSGFRARFHLSDMVGQDEGLRGQLEFARTIANEDCRVLITGETGTGKELLVQGIHNASRRAQGPFVAINCAALPRELFEAELLGYKEGAFTSARRGGQIGKFELADGGTLFLDEISQMPLDMQAKLLRVLQDGIVTRLGDTKPVAVDVRVIAATNENLFEKSQHGGFRSDLYFRLSSIELYLPPLRDRGDDIQLLTETILERLRQRLERPSLVVGSDALEVLCDYDWPGNIRELENVLEMAAITCKGGVLRRENLPPRLRGVAAVQQGKAPRFMNGSGGRGTSLHEEISPIRDVEADVIRQALSRHNGKIAIVARELGISRSTIYRRMREIGLNRVVSVTDIGD